MDRNNVIGLVLIAIILLGYSLYTINTTPEKPPVKAGQTQAPSDSLGVAEVDTLGGVVANDSATVAAFGNDSTLNIDSLKNAVATAKLTQQYGGFATAVTGTEDTFVLENEELRVVVSSLGGNISSIELKNFKTYDQKPLYLTTPGNQNFSLVLNTNVKTSDFYFTSTGVAKNADSQKLVLTATSASGGTLQYIYTLPATGYLLDFDLALSNLQADVVKSTYLELTWDRKVQQAEKDIEQENRNSRLYFREGEEGVDYLSETEDDEIKPTGDADWISFTQPFFNTTLISKGEDVKFNDLTLISKLSKQKGYLKEYSSSMYVPYNKLGTQTYDMEYYLGPNHYQTLKKMDMDLEEVINLGSGIMAWVAIFNKYFIIPIFNFLEPIGNYGVIILLLTLLVKLVLFPLTYKSYLSQAKMKVLKPELDELKERYKDDQARFGQEQMKLWSKAGVNPLGGCLPTLLQMPILVAMYYFFPSSIELRQEKFLWADDLSTYDSIYNFGFNVPLYGDHISLFTLLMAVTSIIYAVSNARLTGQQEGPLKYMPYVFPIMLLGIFNSFPAALTYYYFLANVISYGQQWFIRKFIVDEAALHKQMQEKKAKPSNPNSFGSKISRAMEQAQKAQADRNKTPNKKK